MTPRLLQPADVPGAVRLSQEARWNQTAEDWLRLIELEPQGCFGIEQDGTLVATTTAVCYGAELAWIGMVLTTESCRGKGYARRLLDEALGYLERRGIACVGLDATDLGRPVYARMGFVDEYPVERWIRPPAAAAPTRANPFQLDAAFDRAAFGADRSRLIESLSRIEAASAPGGGYALGRPGANAAFFGPCVARDADSAQRLIEWFLGRHAGEEVFWDLCPGERDAVRLAEEFGFRAVRKLMRMRRGAALPRPAPNAPTIYALAGFELG